MRKETEEFTFMVETDTECLEVSCDNVVAGEFFALSPYNGNHHLMTEEDGIFNTLWELNDNELKDLKDFLNNGDSKFFKRKRDPNIEFQTVYFKDEELEIHDCFVKELTKLMRKYNG